MVQRQELEENIGLMWYNPQTGAITTKKKAVWRNIELDSLMLLYIIMNRLENDRIPFFSNKADLMRGWLKGKTSNRELGWRVKSKLLAEIERLEGELYSLRISSGEQEDYKEIIEVMRKHGIAAYHNPAHYLDEALERGYPRDLDRILEQSEDLQAAIAKVIQTSAIQK
jgi:hypothetical protein